MELYDAQIEVAKYLKLGYLAVADHPDVSREVRMTAHKVRTQHMMSAGLLKSFKVTATHIQQQIPEVLDGVDLLEPCIVEGTFARIIDLAQHMRTEALDTKQEYYKIQTMVQENLAHVKERSKEVVDRKAKLKQETEAELELEQDADIAQYELEAEQAELDKELNKLRDHRDAWMETMEKTDKSVERVSGEKREFLAKKQERRKDALERCVNIRKMTQERDDLDDDWSLMEAYVQLGDVDRQCIRICQWWESIVGMLWKNIVGMLNILQKETENPKWTARLKHFKAEKEEWEFIRRMCSDYVKYESIGELRSIQGLYKFLSDPID